MEKRWRSLPFEMTDGCYGWEVSTQQALTVILNAAPVAFATDLQSVDRCHGGHQTWHTGGTQSLLVIPEPLSPYSLPTTVS